MHICYVHPTSKVVTPNADSPEKADSKKTSTGSMEIRLIDECKSRDDPRLYSREKGEKGADCPPDGSPQYLYIVVEQIWNVDDMIQFIA